MLIVNLFGGPGVGKSTTAAGLFHLLKIREAQVELVCEEAKNFTWERRWTTLECQPYVFAKQFRNIWRLKDHKIEYVITDSPILLSLAYIIDGVWPKSFSQYVLDQFNSFDNFNIFLERNTDKKYSMIGRNQTEQGALYIHRQIKQILLDNEIPYITIKSDQEAPKKIAEKLFENA